MVEPVEVSVFQRDDERILYLASVSGFCQGVERALGKFEEALSTYGAPIYVLYELVHNDYVTSRMRASGAIFVDCLEEVPVGSVLLLGAHGVPRELEEQAARGRYRAVIDCTCPFVRVLHRRASQVSPEDDLLLYGKPGHTEALGILGHAGTSRLHVLSEVTEVDSLPSLHHPVLLVQTTMNHQEAGALVSRLRGLYPDLRCPRGDVCHASQERQESLLSLCRLCEGILVVGSAHSSNANRLVEVARGQGCSAWLIEDSHSIPPAALSLGRLGLIGGASVPRSLLQGVQDSLCGLGYAVKPC